MKDWKTTVVGVLGAIASVVAPMLQSGQVNAKDLILAGALALIGYFAGDKKADTAK